MAGEPIDLSGKVAVVTGAGRGIGAAMAEGLASYGAAVTILDLPERAGESADVVATIEEAGGVAQAVEGDVREPQSLAQAVSALVSRHGKLDIMVNNAGVIVRAPALELTEEGWDTVHDVNLRGVFFGCQAAAREMVKGGGGSIINTTSELAFVVPKARISATYIASKGGVVSLTRALAVEWAGYNIRVNAIAPGGTRTAMDTLDPVKELERYQAIVKEIPLGHLMEPGELAGTVVFLASDLAAMITGQTIVVDGGRTLL